MIKNILFDFDGVILDSMPIKELGFREIFSGYGDKEIEEFISFHKKNGGISRFVKIRYFYEEILNKKISEDEILNYSDRFSAIMKKELCDKKYLIKETLEFIIKNKDIYNMHIVSGTENSELNFLCDKLEISNLFKTINGSPLKKSILIKNILEKFTYDVSATVLIGDSINDYEAACENLIDFYGFNNSQIIKYCNRYINTFADLSL